MVHQVFRFESKDAFSTWEEEFIQEENSLRSEGLMESPIIYSRDDESIAVDLRWKNLDSARNYIKRHKYFSKVSTDEKPRSEEINTYISEKRYRMTTESDHKKLTREGIARLADRGVILTTEKKMQSTPSILYQPEESGIKNIETGKIFTYDEVKKNIRKIPEEEKLKLFTNVSVKYFN